MEIRNKVAESSLVTLDLSIFKNHNDIISFDLKDFLFMEYVLKEKEFRMRLKELDWSRFRGELVALFCSNDALIPTWAFMLCSVYLNSVAKRIYFGSNKSFSEILINEEIDGADFSHLEDATVVVKGCGEDIPQSSYAELTTKLKPLVRSLMFGEPCSTVPIYKRPKN